MPELLQHKNGIWYIRYSQSGRKVWKSLRTRDEKKAKGFYKELDARHTLGILGLSQKQNPPLKELFTEYLPFCKVNRALRTFRDTDMHIRLFLYPALGHIRVMDLSPKHLEDFISKMRETGYASRTIDLRLETLRKVLRRAVDNRVIAKMPVAIKLIREPRSNPKYVTPDKLETWLSYLSPHHLLRAELSFHTGITDIDIGNLTWDNFDREVRLITYTRPKTKKPIPVPLNERAMEIFTILETTKEGPYLFKGVCSVRKAYATASKKSGVKVTPHMLRHTFATALLSKSVPIAHVSKLLGHGDISTTQIYADVLPEYLRESIAVLDKKSIK